MTLNYLIIGKRISTIRKERKLTQARLAECIDKSTGFISYIETGKKVLSLETLVQIANALGVSADALLNDVIIADRELNESEFGKIIHECNSYEKMVIIENAKALLSILKEHSSQNKYK